MAVNRLFAVRNSPHLALTIQARAQGIRSLPRHVHFSLHCPNWAKLIQQTKNRSQGYSSADHPSSLPAYLTHNILISSQNSLIIIISLSFPSSYLSIYSQLGVLELLDIRLGPSLQNGYLAIAITRSCSSQFDQDGTNAPLHPVIQAWNNFRQDTECWPYNVSKRYLQARPNPRPPRPFRKPWPIPTSHRFLPPPQPQNPLPLRLLIHRFPTPARPMPVPGDDSIQRQRHDHHP